MTAHYAIPGTLVYIDSFLGLLPAKIVRAWQGQDINGRPTKQIEVRLTGRTEYSKPEGFGPTEKYLSRWIVPRDRVRGMRSMFGSHILPFRWELAP